MNWDIVDFDYFETFKMEMSQGRSFSREFATDVSEAYVINEEAAKLMGVESPVGKQLSVFRNEGKIIGIVKNFHFKSLHHEIRPFIYWMNPNWTSMMDCMFVRVAPDNISETIKYMETVCLKFNPVFPFRYQFFDERIDTLYRNEQRTKEIGIRKVLGASVSNVVLLLSKEFIKWVIVANIIAWPVSYFVISRWLKNFAYHVNAGLWLFVLSGLLALVIALLTVSYQALKAATANPVDSLRYV